ncbi:TPA: glutamine synthetase, partial [Candidatus Poribacteria bacterium]|nr:glutamine synthetase [Candidatus Poribacteria bacterium]
EPIERNIYEMTEEERIREGIETLPESLYEAITITEKSELVRRTLGDHIFYKLIENKKIEWNKHRIRVTTEEIKDYLPIL